MFQISEKIERAVPYLSNMLQRNAADRIAKILESKSMEQLQKYLELIVLQLANTIFNDHILKLHCLSILIALLPASNAFGSRTKKTKRAHDPQLIVILIIEVFLFHLLFLPSFFNVTFLFPFFYFLFLFFFQPSLFIQLFISIF